MIANAETEVLLGHLAERFESSAQEISAAEGGGWGQFLDAPKTHTQVGLYGTCAGVITLTLAGRGQSPVCQLAAKRLATWWQARNQVLYTRQRFVQTLRLAFLCLACRLSELGGLDAISLEAETSLFARQLQSGGWGDWWLSESSHDSTPRIFTSSVVIMMLLLFRQSLPPAQAAKLTKATQLLSRACESPGHLSALELAAATAALSIWHSFTLGTRQPPSLSRAAWSAAREPKHGNYFFFFQYSADAKGQSFGRDYLLAPPNLLFAVGGFQRRSRGTLRLAAEDTLGDLVEQLKAEGAYRVSKHDHVSSLDQVWVAIILTLALTAPSFTSPGMTAKAVYGLRKERDDNWFTDLAFPLFAGVFFIVANAVPVEDDTRLKILISLGTWIAAALYGDNVVRKFFRGSH